MNPASSLVSAFHANLDAFVQPHLVPSSINGNGRIVFVPFDQRSLLPQLISLGGGKIDPDKIPGFPAAIKEGDAYAEGSFRHRWEYVQELIHELPLSTLINRYRAFTNDERKRLEELMRKHGEFSVGRLLARSRETFKSKGSDIRELAELFYVSGESKSQVSPSHDFASYLASGILFASLGEDDGERMAEAALLQGAISARTSSYLYIEPMMMELAAELRRTETYFGDLDRFVLNRTAARLWAVEPAKDKDPSSMVFRMLRSMWHALACGDYETFAEQNESYGNLLPASEKENLLDAGWAFARAAWGLSKLVMNGESGTHLDFIHQLLIKMDSYFAGLEENLDPIIKAKSTELSDQAFKILMESKK